MTAQKWVAVDFGGPEVLRLVEVRPAPPEQGEVTIAVRAAGMNPADHKHLAPGQDRRLLPLAIGYEVAGVITAVGPGTEIASGAVAVGDEVLASTISGGYASAVTVPAADVFAKPANLSFEAAANLLLVGTTATELLHVTGARAGETILLHGASGAVGASVLQQARFLGVHVVGTAGENSFASVEQFGGRPVRYGAGLEARVREAAPEGVAAALDTAGTDEAIDVSLALVSDPSRIVTLAAPARAAEDGLLLLGSANPASAPFRASARARVLRLAAQGHLVVPIARSFPLAEAPAALTLLLGRHPAGKLALVTEGRLA